jgi:sec-independent protein translocase protein TatB
VFDVAPQELLLLGAVAIAVIPPKDLPRAMRFAGQWIGKARGMARHFRSGLDEMIRQSELDEIEKKWREENERIMREHPLHDAIEHPALPADAGETLGPAALPAPDADMIAEPPPAAADLVPPPEFEPGILTAENGTELPPPIPEGNPPPIAEATAEVAPEPAPRPARAPRAPKAVPVEDDHGPELPFDLPPRP